VAIITIREDPVIAWMTIGIIFPILITGNPTVVKRVIHLEWGKKSDPEDTNLH
jgi:hypothetical protein